MDRKRVDLLCRSIPGKDRSIEWMGESATIANAGSPDTFLQRHGIGAIPFLKRPVRLPDLTGAERLHRIMKKNKTRMRAIPYATAL